MRQTAIGKTGLEVGAIAYGCWRFTESSLQDADLKIRTALEVGMTLIDTADIYGYGEPRGFGGAEAVLGEVLAADRGLRDQMFLATKGGITPPRPYDSSYAYLMAAMDNWGDEVPDGETTSFPMAVKAEPGEVIVFSWIEWPSKEARDKGMV